jgi:hypothetical protein
MTNEKQITTDREFLNQKNEAIKEREIYTDKEASSYLRISQVTLWRERKAGKISFRRVASKIVYLHEDLEAYLNRNKREAFASN